jgi:hypothetical protein
MDVPYTITCTSVPAGGVREARLSTTDLSAGCHVLGMMNLDVCFMPN